MAKVNAYHKQLIKRAYEYLTYDPIMLDVFLDYEVLEYAIERWRKILDDTEYPRVMAELGFFLKCLDDLDEQDLLDLEEAEDEFNHGEDNFPPYGSQSPLADDEELPWEGEVVTPFGRHEQTPPVPMEYDWEDTLDDSDEGYKL